MSNDGHHPVMLQQVIDALAIKPDGIYVDATFGRGGHSSEILKHLGDKGFLLAIDKDPAAVLSAKRFEQDKRFCIKQGSFEMLQTYAQELQIEQKVDGILLDLGVSSPQLDDAARGFSFLQEGPLDMRMNPLQDLDAATWINSATENEIAGVLRTYGEERYAKRIAAAIVRERNAKPIQSTKRLAQIVAAANPAWERHKHPATRSFQAIRIFINRELTELEACLKQCLAVLALGGRLVVMSFHSLEDRIVKQFIQHEERGQNFPRGLPVTEAQLCSRLRRVVWGVKPEEAEIKKNFRARSAILRVAEKIK